MKLIALACVFLTAQAASAAEIVMFSVRPCLPCTIMEPVVGGMQAKGWPIRKVDAREQPDFAAKCGATKFPCFAMITDDGKVAERMWGVMTANDLAAMYNRHKPNDCHGKAAQSQPTRVVPPLTDIDGWQSAAPAQPGPATPPAVVVPPVAPGPVEAPVVLTPPKVELPTRPTKHEKTKDLEPVEHKPNTKESEAGTTQPITASADPGTPSFFARAWNWLGGLDWWTIGTTAAITLITGGTVTAPMLLRKAGAVAVKEGIEHLAKPHAPATAEEAYANRPQVPPNPPKPGSDASIQLAALRAEYEQRIAMMAQQHSQRLIEVQKETETRFQRVNIETEGEKYREAIRRVVRLRENSPLANDAVAIAEEIESTKNQLLHGHNVAHTSGRSAWKNN